MKFYPGEETLCKLFVEAMNKLNITVSTAQLQGLFVMNKDKPQSALEMIETLRHSNHVL